MHKFFERQDAAFPFDVPTRVYALLIDGEGSDFVLFDAVAAEFFDQNYEPLSQPRPPGSWQQHADHAPIYAIEINASDAVTTAASWLKRHPHDALPRWSQIELVADDRGEAAVCDNIAGPPQRARISAGTLQRASEQPEPLRYRAVDLGSSWQRPGYADISTLAAGKAIAGLVVAHHGGRSPGPPPPRPGVGTPRAALSYGYSNSYKHPLGSSIQSLTASHWSIGHPAAGLDECRTEDRPPHGTGGLGLGHIRLNWTGNTGPPHACRCGCTLNPTQ